ncbi:hypothetical protein RND71_034849 [Anisodus tanguticus]|uniref:GST C-terminal domain-containing protein n=1 Tax=Anisodus tanguticus TaxID=243964 RepID=A0AAE1R4D2_9SOLA|nr:hypothetical protein RND71_034849 [Anisodus tanguticus]
MEAKTDDDVISPYWFGNPEVEKCKEWECGSPFGNDPDESRNETLRSSRRISFKKVTTTFFYFLCVPTTWKALWSKGEEQKKDKEEAYEILKVIDNELKDMKFFGGDNIGFVDIVANFIGFWIEIFEEVTGLMLVTSEKCPNICAWRNEYLNCNQVMENMPPREMLLDIFKAQVEAVATTTTYPMKSHNVGVWGG